MTHAVAYLHCKQPDFSRLNTESPNFENTGLSKGRLEK